MLALRLGKASYAPVWALQTALVEARAGGLLDTDVALLVEHDPVFTLGRRGRTDGFIVPPEHVQRSGVPVIHVERGGDVTYHGPGQLVVYPIVDLRQARFKVVEFVEGLEEVMIRVAGNHGVKARRRSLNRGVWVADRKLGSVGIAVRRDVSFHGLALNVNPDMTPFQWIHPCGLQGVAMTSLAEESAREIGIHQVMPHVLGHMEGVFETQIMDTSLASVARSLGSGFPQEARVLLNREATAAGPGEATV